MLVVHSNPVVEPGVGDAGGMTVYVRQMARSLAARGLDVDIYTRRDSVDTPDVTTLFPGVVVRPYFMVSLSPDPAARGAARGERGCRRSPGGAIRRRTGAG